MAEIKKYRLGNQSEEYELSDKYLCWIPWGCMSWEDFHDEGWRFNENRPETITLVSIANERVTLNLHKWLVKDELPLHFRGEARAEEWCNFLLVSEKETPEIKFVIPVH